MYLSVVLIIKLLTLILPTTFLINLFFLLSVIKLKLHIDLAKLSTKEPIVTAGLTVGTGVGDGFACICPFYKVALSFHIENKIFLIRASCHGKLNGLGKPAEGGYWQLVRSFENDYEKSKADDAYTESWSGGGSYTYNCKTTFDHHYTGSTHNTCRGEFVNNTGTASAPNSRYAGGEQVKITLTVSAATSSNICFNLGAHLTSCITPVNHNDPFISYGTETYLQNIDDESAKGDVRTYKNDTNTGYIGESVTSGATMPMGYEDGDKVYILIIFTGGNNLIKTAYEYEWHS